MQQTRENNENSFHFNQPCHVVVLLTDFQFMLRVRNLENRLLRGEKKKKNVILRRLT